MSDDGRRSRHVVLWDVIRAAADPPSRLAREFAGARAAGEVVLVCDLAPDDPAVRAGIEALLRLCRAGAPCPPTRGEVLAAIFGARLTVGVERASPLALRPHVPRDASPVARGFLGNWLGEPPGWAPGGRLPLSRVEFTLLEVRGADLARAPRGA